VAVDFPNKHVYWVDSFLAHIERVDYDGSNRKTLKKGSQFENIHSITVFENSIFVSVWKSRQILELDRFGLKEPKVVASYKDVGTVHVYHRQRQPDGDF